MSFAHGRASLIAMALAVSFAPYPARAQDDPAAGGLDVQVFGDWTLRCLAAGCDMIQVLTERENGVQVGSLSIAYSTEQARSAVQIVAPLGVHLPTGLTISADDLMVAGVRFTRCEVQGCFVEARLGDDMLAAMRAAPSMTLGFGLDVEQTVSVDVGLDGFTEAYDALLAEMAARATGEATEE